jgi:hypothetical protein
MGLPSIKALTRVLIRTCLTQLKKINRSFNKANTELIKKLCDSLFIIDKTKIIYLITRILNDKKVNDKKVDNKEVNNKEVNDKKVNDKKVNDKKLKRVDIIFDYNLLIIKYQLQVVIYSITIIGLNLTIKPLFNPNIRQSVNL